MIKNIPKEYFQKSKIFLYPILGIPRGNNFIPVNTYVAWNNKIVKEEFSFLCVYNIVDSQEYRDFELKYLFDNKRFKGFYYLEDNKGVYIFDFTDFTDDYLLFLGSNYSQMSNQIKNLIIKFFKSGKVDNVNELVNSYLNPNNYYEQYSKYLKVDVSILKEVRELCPKMDLEKETLEASELILDL
jgi:hypothetical protein